MVKKHNETVSEATQKEALAIAKKNQKPGQNKEQTKLIALGIQKGIADYKKTAKAKQRDANKLAKKKQKQALNNTDAVAESIETASSSQPTFAWILLAVSWIGFAAYFYINTLS